MTSGQAGGYAAYLDGRTLAAELGDYYLQEGERVEAPGRWLAGAEAVGADEHQAVTGDQLRALMAVSHPDTGLPLRRVGGNGEAVAAIDATFSAPKSVSAAWALASPELRQAIESAHERAVDRALAYAVERVPMVRQRDGKRVHHVPAREVVATSWRHTTARAVADQPPDPQLHSHVLLHAAIRKDGRIVAIDSRSIFVHRRELGAAYRTQLAHQLSELGFGIERGTGRGGRYFELAGIPAGLIDRWSSRHREVQLAIEARLADKHAALQKLADAGGPDAPAAAAALETLARSGRLLPAEERYLASSTRAPKALATHGDLDRHWWQTAQTFGLDGLGVERLRSIPRPLEAASSEVLLDRLTEFDATFAAREARAVALEASAGAPIEDALAGLGLLGWTGELLPLADGRQTTRTHRASERHTIQLASRLAKARLTPLPTETIERQRLALDAELKAHGGELSHEQHRALQLGCSDRQLVIIEGQAGTGKSTTLTAIARAHHTQQRQVIVTSTAALAAQHLASELEHASASAQAHSTAALHAAIANGTLTLDPGTTVIHDEAALASTREQHQLLSAVEASGARLIMVGDPGQSQAVGAGGLWADLERHARAHQAHVRLTQVVRAQDPADRRDQTLYRARQTDRALAGYHARGRVHLTPDQRQAEDHALDAAHADRRAGRRTMVIAQTSNEHLDQLNARAQAIRAQDGELGEHTLPLRGRPYRLRAGDHIQIRHPLQHPQLGRIPNGTTATVDHVPATHDQAILRLADGREARFTQDQADAASVRLAYVQHPFPAQGHTTDTTHLLVAEHATQEGCYVALTRARQQTHIHATHPQLEHTDQDPLAALAERMGRTEPEIASIRTPLAHEHQLTRQHTQEHQPTNPWLALLRERTSQPEPDRVAEADRVRELADRLEQARAQLADAKRVLASYPVADERARTDALAQAEHAAQRRTVELERVELLRERLDELGPIARLRWYGRELKGLLAGAEQTTERHHQDHQQHLHTADQHQHVLQDWHAHHPDAHQHLKNAQHHFDQLIDLEARRRLEHPGEHLTRALRQLPRPGPGQNQWHYAALEIERYRTRYQIDPTDPTPLGPQPTDHGQQLADYNHTHELTQSITTHLAMFPSPPDPHHLAHQPDPGRYRAPYRHPPTLGHDGPSLSR